MIGRSIGVLFVVGSGLVLAGCGAKAHGSGVGPGAGTGGSNGSGTLSPPGGYQTPPPGQETPPPTYETPPPIYDNPGGAGAEACTTLCNSFVNRTCGGQVITAQQVAECPGECRTLIDEFEPCGEEYGNMLACMLRSRFFQELLDAACSGQEPTVDDADLEELINLCQTQAIAFESCYGEGPGEDPEPGGGCSQNNQCAGCPNACAECQCIFGAGAETCAIDCNPPQ